MALRSPIKSAWVHISQAENNPFVDALWHAFEVVAEAECEVPSGFSEAQADIFRTMHRASMGSQVLGQAVQSFSEAFQAMTAEMTLARKSLEDSMLPGGEEGQEGEEGQGQGDKSDDD